MSNEHSDLIAREALRRAPLVREGRAWRFGRRLFSNVTINNLIASGDAVRVGDKVVRA